MEILSLITLFGSITCNTPDKGKCLDLYYNCVNIQIRKIDAIPISKASRLTILKSETINCNIKILINNGSNI